MLPQLWKNASRASCRWRSDVASAVPTLYYDVLSPPCRFVRMAAETSGARLHVQQVDIFAGEQYQPEFQKINPMKKIPVLVDGSLTICDSHAIACYICDVLALDDRGEQIYPRAPDERARVQQFLNFNCGMLFPIDSAIMSEYFAGHQKVRGELKTSLQDGMSILEHYLELNPWLTGSQVTLADICCAATLTTVDLLVPLDKEKYVRVAEWLASCNKLPCFRINDEGLTSLKNKIKVFKK